MKCPLCGSSESKVIDSRSLGDGIRRRRQCLKCNSRFTTHERAQPKGIYVIKKDGRREEFNREKLLTGIRKACEKRPLPTGLIDKLVDNIETELYKMGRTEIPSSIVGDKVMDKLEELDHIAYIRFASIYREFADIAAMKHEVDKLLNAKNGAPPPGQLFLIKPEQCVNSNKLKQRRQQ